MTSTETPIGRTEINDLEAILQITNHDVDAVAHTVANEADTIFTWDYAKGARPALERLYEMPRPRSGTARPTCPGTSTSTRSRSSRPTPWPTTGG